nr:retrotransposon protein, putative, Ty1-copia subclass [Tanacetum cinerariifolium]
MLQELKTLFAQQAKQELLQTTRDFHSCRQKEGQSVSSYVLKMKGHIDNLERLGHPVTLGLGYLAELLKKKKNAASEAGGSGLRASRKLKSGVLSLYVGNGEAAYILGIKIYRDRSKRLIGLCKSSYIEKILKRYCMENSKRGSIPMQEKLKLSKSQGASTPAELKRIQNVPYASAVGSIMYAERCTRLDVAFAQNVTSRFQQNPEAEYIAAFDASKEAVWVRKFISGLGVVLTIEEPISTYCDNTGAIAIANESEITQH